MNQNACYAHLIVGVMMITGGLCAMWFASAIGGVHVTGYGPFDGYWPASRYFLIGTVLAMLGSGSFTLGFLNRRR